MHKIFISRKLSEHSIIKMLLQEGHQIHDESLINITPLTFKLEKVYDWIFFYSKNGIKYFYDQQKEAIDSKIIVMGEASNKYLERRTKKKADHIARLGKEGISLLNQILKDQSILFVQAQNSIERFQNEIHSAKSIEKIWAYDNAIKSEIQIPRSDILVFTSPLNVKAYFNQYHLESNQKLVAIGPTTANSIFETSGINAFTPDDFDENSLYNLILKLTKNG